MAVALPLGSLWPSLLLLWSCQKPHKCIHRPFIGTTHFRRQRGSPHLSNHCLHLLGIKQELFIESDSQTPSGPIHLLKSSTSACRCQKSIRIWSRTSFLLSYFLPLENLPMEQTSFSSPLSILQDAGPGNLERLVLWLPMGPLPCSCWKSPCLNHEHCWLSSCHRLAASHSWLR